MKARAKYSEEAKIQENNFCILRIIYVDEEYKK